jgi:K+:H+ antiporter
MLFNSAILARQPLAVLATFLIIVLGKSFAAYIIVRAFGYPSSTAPTISASLAQIGEFSFILIVLGVQLAIVPDTARDLVVAGAILSIVVNPLFFKTLDQLTEHQGAASVSSSLSEGVPAPEQAPTALSGHVILVGHGRVGSRVGADILAAKVPFLVVDEDNTALVGVRARGVDAYAGRCGEQGLLDLLNLAGAKCLIAAIPDPYEAGHLIEVARAANPSMRVIARAHSAEGVKYLRTLGADVVLMGEEELANGMARAVLGERGPAADLDDQVGRPVIDS